MNQVVKDFLLKILAAVITSIIAIGGAVYTTSTINENNISHLELKVNSVELNLRNIIKENSNDIREIRRDLYKPN